MRVPHYSLLIIAVLTAALTSSGCAGAAAARRLSAGGAKLTDGYKSDMQDFFQAEDQMIQGTVQSIAIRQQDAAELDNLTRVQRGSWQAANNTTAVRIYDSLSNQSASTILASNIDLKSLHPPTAPPATTIDTKQFESVTSTLNQMAQPLSLQDQITFLVKEGQDIAKQYQQSSKDAAKCANTANTANKNQMKGTPAKPPSTCSSP